MKYENLIEVFTTLENYIEDYQKLEERAELIDFLEDNTGDEYNNTTYFLKSLYINKFQLLNIALFTEDDLLTEKEIQVNIFMDNEDDLKLSRNDLSNIEKVNEFINNFKYTIQDIASEFSNIAIL